LITHPFAELRRLQQGTRAGFAAGPRHDHLLACAHSKEVECSCVNADYGSPFVSNHSFRSSQWHSWGTQERFERVQHDP
jgi:hypothetical protein